MTGKFTYSIGIESKRYVTSLADVLKEAYSSGYTGVVKQECQSFVHFHLHTGLFIPVQCDFT